MRPTAAAAGQPALCQLTGQPIGHAHGLGARCAWPVKQANKQVASAAATKTPTAAYVHQRTSSALEQSSDSAGGPITGTAAVTHGVSPCKEQRLAAKSVLTIHSLHPTELERPGQCSAHMLYIYI